MGEKKVRVELYMKTGLFIEGMYLVIRKSFIERVCSSEDAFLELIEAYVYDHSMLEQATEAYQNSDYDKEWNGYGGRWHSSLFVRASEIESFWVAAAN